MKKIPEKSRINFTHYNDDFTAAELKALAKKEKYPTMGHFIVDAIKAKVERIREKARWAG